MRVAWSWNASFDSANESSENERWEAYNDEVTTLIETAYQAQKEEVSIGDGYIINLKANVQINTNDNRNWRRVKRVEFYEERQRLASGRFCMNDELEKPKTFSHSQLYMCPFVEEWIKRNPNYRHTLDNTIELIAQGIINEGKTAALIELCIVKEQDLINGERPEHDAHEIARELRALKGSSFDDVVQYCVRAYTKECFLYKLINKALREKHDSRIDNLGPFCCFLRHYLYRPERSEAVVYRGMKLAAEAVNQYKAAIGQIRCWLSFSSTSTKLEVATGFNGGNTLFVIHFNSDISHYYPGKCIADLSAIPSEEEVLLQPGVDFKILDVKENGSDESKTYIINLLLM